MDLENRSHRDRYEGCRRSIRPWTGLHGSPPRLDAPAVTAHKPSGSKPIAFSTWSPELAFFLQVIALWQSLLPCIATEDDAEIKVDVIDKLLAVHH